MSLELERGIAVSLGRLTRGDESAPNVGIVHLGVGAFHRGHQAWYTHKAMKHSDGDWGILGVSLRSGKVAEQLNPQSGAYTLVEQDERNISTELVTSLTQVLVAPNNPQDVLDALADASVKIVSLTITEKGYCHQPSDGQLNFDSPEIQYDLAHPDAPVTAIGFLVYAMQSRIAKGIPAFSVLSCDNLRANGLLLQNLILAFAERISPLLAEQIQSQYTFPCCMVDRIVPSIDETKRQAFCQVLDVDDQAIVVTEPFHQWVIEDMFVQGRPAWEKVGALMVSSVHNYESMKLQLLNGSHSAIAYIGKLSGFDTVSAAVQHPHFRRYLHELMLTELLPSLIIPPEINVYHYCEQLLHRFSNTRLVHETQQIAMDGTQKLPQRWMKPLTYQLNHGLCAERLYFAIANWIQFSSGKGLKGEPMKVQDPIAEELSLCFNCDVKLWVESILALPNLFDEAVASDALVVESITHWLTRLQYVDSPMALLSEVIAKSEK